MGRKKNLVIDDDEYSIGAELSEESLAMEDKVVAPPVAGKKKGKKGKSKKGGSKAGFSLLEDEENDQEQIQSEKDEPVVSFEGKKKKSPSKGSKNGDNLFSESAFDAIGDEEGEERLTEDANKSDDDEVGVISFSGKKKKSKSSKKSSKFDALDEDVDVADEKKEEEDGMITFSGKKKSSKKKSAAAFSALGDADNTEVDPKVNDIATSNTEVVAETSKNKKKKKSGRTAQDEEDLDKILAELGEVPPMSKARTNSYSTNSR